MVITDSFSMVHSQIGQLMESKRRFLVFTVMIGVVIGLSAVNVNGDISEGGENGLSNLTVQTDGVNAGTNVLSTRFVADTMPHSFRLILDGFSMQDEFLMLNSPMTVGVGSELRFKSMLGLTGDGEIASVQVCTSQAAVPSESSWVNIYSQHGVGQSGTEQTFSQRIVSLGAFVGQTIRIRFLYHLEPGKSWFWQDWEYAGWFIDQIQVTDGVIGYPNQQPSFTKGSDKMVLEDTGLQTVMGWATGISGGPANESNQIVDFIVSNDNPTLFAIAPSIAPNGTLTFRSAPDANGSAIVTVRIHDNGGTANGGVDTSAAHYFNITVTAVNDAPVAQDRVLGLINGVAHGTLAATDVDGDSLPSFGLVRQATKGWVTISENGEFIYTPGLFESGNDSFAFEAYDSSYLGSDLATVTLEISTSNAVSGVTLGQTSEGFVLSWPSAAGRVYYVQSVTNLDSAHTWETEVTGIVPAADDSNGITHWVDAASSETAKKFYRILVNL